MGGWLQTLCGEPRQVWDPGGEARLAQTFEKGT